MPSTLGGVQREGWNCRGGVEGISRGIWKKGNCKYEFFILKQIIFHRLLIYLIHHLLWLLEKKHKTNPRKSKTSNIKNKKPWFMKIDLWESPFKTSSSKFYETTNLENCLTIFL